MVATSNSNVRSGDFQPPPDQSIFGITTTMRFSVFCCLALSLLVEAHGRASSSYYRDSSSLYPSRQSYRGLPFAASYLPPSRRQQHMTNPYELYSMVYLLLNTKLVFGRPIQLFKLSLIVRPLLP